MGAAQPPAASAPLMKTLLPREKDGEGTLPTVESTKSWKKKHIINPQFLKKIIEFCTNGKFWKGCILEWGFLQL